MLAHVDSGKTTLCEEMLYISGMIRKKGRVDHGDAYLDQDAIERRRGITIFSKQAALSYGGMEATLLDTPGHADFSAEMERTLSVLDLAVLIIGSNDGIAAHTVVLWKLLKKNGIPVFLFVNKMDLAVKKREEILQNIQKQLSERCVPASPDPTEEELDALSLYDDRLAELILSGAGKEEIREEIADAVSRRLVCPVFFGSALRGEGVEDLLRGIGAYTKDLYRGRDAEGRVPSGRIFKVAHDGKDALAYLKLEQGVLRPKDRVLLVKRGGPEEEKAEEKINEIRAYSGEKYVQKAEAGAGEVVAVTGLADAAPGDALGESAPAGGEVLEPFMTFSAVPEDPGRIRDLVEALKELSAEDPKLGLELSRGGKDVRIRLMGSVQTEVLTEILDKRYGIRCRFTESRIIYKETITGEVEGVGHFEPLRHYAEVHVVLSPNERGTGITVSNAVPPDLLDQNWQNLILHHITERNTRGVLTGAMLTDVNIELVSGRASKKHTEGGDFREATYRAIRQGLMAARAKGLVRLLEPWLDIDITAETNDIGRVMTDLTAMGGKLNDPVTLDEGKTRITGRAPVSEVAGYADVVRGYSHGSASYASQLSGYEFCHNEKEVIEETGYEPESDLRFTPDSVFCEKGSSIIVPWNEVYDHMHLSLREDRKDAQGGGSDEALANAALIEQRKRAYREKLATDKELQAIFERTYGPVRTRLRQDVPRVNGRPADEQKPGTPKRCKAKTKEGRPKETVLFIDGYNLIHAWPYLKELSETDFGAARDQLIDTVSNYAAFMGYNTTLVFDAYKVTEGTGSKVRVHGVDVVYTREHETADAYIEKATHEVMKRKSGAEIRVVTSDALVQQLSLGHGALRISSREFVDEVGRVDELIRKL